MVKHSTAVEGAARMPKSPKSRNTVRMHVQMPKKWQKDIMDAAKKKNMSRSNFVANVAWDAAKVILGAGA